jgi:isopropylmalate/homocitrate/citramalate synthase
MSGLSNVKHWLASHGYDAEDEEMCRRIFEAAKSTDRTLSDDEIEALIREA